MTSSHSFGSKANDGNNAVSNAFFKAEEEFKKTDEDWKTVPNRRNNRPNKSKDRSFVRHDERTGESSSGKQDVSSNSNKRHKNNYNKEPKKHQSDRREQPQRSRSSGNSQEKKEYDQPQVLSYGKLQQISLKDSTEIIRTLANSRCGLDELLAGFIKPDFMYLIMKILSKLTKSDWFENKEHILVKASTPEFFGKLSEFVFQLATEDQSSKRMAEMEQFFDHLLTYFQAVMSILPTVAAEHMVKPLRTTSMVLHGLGVTKNIVINTKLLDKIKELNSDIEERKREKEERERISREQKEQIYPKSFGSIRNIPLYPKPVDIASEQGVLVPNKVKGSYTSVEDYLDVQFRLLREDFVSPVRQGINEYRRGQLNKKSQTKRTSNLRIYPRVKFLKPKVIVDKVGYDICFDPEKRFKVKWEYSKRFIFGSLLLFTTDNFHTFFLATVVKRDIPVVEKDRVISVVLCDTNEVSKDLLTKEFVMAETEVYFEPYYNVLKALQQFDAQNFPFKKYFVYVQTQTDRPSYTQNGGDIYTISKGDDVCGRKTIRLFDPYTWPSNAELGFDTSQMEAFKAALTNDLVVIQGPPGTGKTFIGLKITAALLENSAMWNFNRKSPILVICFTNHALDQFLEGILLKDLTRNLVRIGGRSKSEILEPFNLKERRRTIVHDVRFYDQAALLKDLKKEMSIIFEDIKTLQDNLEALDKLDGIVSVSTLKLVMSEMHQQFFGTNDDLLKWLLQGVSVEIKNKSNRRILSSEDKTIKRKKHAPDNDFGIDEEDFENTTRLKEVLFDNVELDDLSNQESNPNCRLLFSVTLEEIQKKIEECDILIRELPGSENKREIIQRKIQEAQESKLLLGSIATYLQDKFRITTIPTIEDSMRLFELENLNSLSANDRWLLYCCWIEFLKAGFWSNISQLEERFRKGHRRYEEARQFEDLSLIQQTDVVGVTTTTAARLQAMLRELKPKIGDHKQLRPSPADYRLGKDFKLDVSLFERLINNGVGYFTLKTQHRMRPEISRLLVPTIYPSLTDHPSTKQRSSVRGFHNSIFFMTHNHHEEEVADIISKRNLFEARMAMNLARHLLLQGYRPDEITVLATYKGQMYLLKEEQVRLGISKDLLVTVVDNFQGEENRIIILSLVRSNADNRIGFLKTENRVCVALSRARDGLFVFGNMECLTGSGSVLWQKIRQSFIDQEAFGPALLLRCQTHQREITRVMEPADFTAVIEGGCSRMCGETLPCGHRCKSLCHVSKDRHLKYTCNEPCNRVCKEGHRCEKKCFQDCGRCTVGMRRSLECGHYMMLPCCVEYKNLQCKELVMKRFDECGHELQLECFRRGYKKCPKPCESRLDCGHQCVRTCHTDDDPDHLEYECTKACGRGPRLCTVEGHSCPRRCCDPCEPCEVEVVKHLPCGHTQTVPCKKTDLVCTLPCPRTLACGHQCQRTCKESCDNCPVLVEKEVFRCGHRVRVACYKEPSRLDCDGRCVIPLACGHKCAKRCKDPCDADDCVEPVSLRVSLPCGHSGANVPCNIARKIHAIKAENKEELVQYCNEPCMKELKCKHMCSGTCGQCMQGRIHKVCDEDCNNTLICGHSCPVPCREICPPCGKPCQNRCVHTRCPKKCGEPCVPCQEPCEYHCPHDRCSRKCGEFCNIKPCTKPCFLKLRCGHECVGFCGDPCPPCKLCNPEHYEEFFYTGEETEDDAKWVLLKDCNHVVESSGMDHWISVDDKEIKMKRCPKCRPTEPNRFLMTTPRYMNTVKKTFRDIQAVKLKVFGQIQEIRRNREDLLEKLEEVPGHAMNDFQNYDSGHDQLTKLRQSLIRELNYVKDHRRNEISIHKSNLLEFMVTHVYLQIQGRVVKEWRKLTDRNKEKIFNHVNFLINILNQRKEKISHEEMMGFNCEIFRFHRIFDLSILESSSSFKTLVSFEPSIQTEVLRLHETLKKDIYSLRMFTRNEDDRVQPIFEKISKLLQHTVSDEERRMIHRAMATSFQGGERSVSRWYKCAGCGDVYCVANCGAVNQIAKCGRCKTTIGDSSRRPDEKMGQALQNLHFR